jgi:transposase, IS5 family
MLRDRYEPMNLFAAIPTLDMRMAPMLAQMERLLDDTTLFQTVKADLVKRFPATATDGRPATPVEVLFRMLVVKPLDGWRVPQTAHALRDRLVLRQFCRVSVAPVPAPSTLHRWAKLLQPATLPRGLEPLVSLARQLQVTQGRTLRLAGTGVETTLHHPTDSTLLHDGVRGRSRALDTATTLLGGGPVVTQDAAPPVPQQARDKRQRLMEVARPRGAGAAKRLTTTSRALIDLTTTVVARAAAVREALRTPPTAAPQRVAGTLARVIALVEQVSTPTTRRVLHGAQVPASEKLVSLFAPATARSRQGTPGTPTEFGRCRWLDEVDGGIISRYAVWDGQPDEQAPLPPSLDPHRPQFGHPPTLLTGDRGLYAVANARDAQQRGVTEVVLPKPGTKSAKRLAPERQAWLRAGRTWRAGIEGRMSGRKRRH